MDHQEMAELLTEKVNVPIEEAQRVLKEKEWDILDAVIELEERQIASGQALTAAEKPTGGEERAKPAAVEDAEKKESVFTNGFAQIWYYIRRLLYMLVRNNFVILHKDKPLLKFPFLILGLLLVFRFWITVIALVAAMFVGCRYRFEGKEFGKEAANETMDKIGDAVDNIKEKIVKDESRKE